MKIEEAKRRLASLDPNDKYDTMIKTAAIITKMLEKYEIKPIIVGGLSVEIYTQNDYSTRDIDFVADGYAIIEKLLHSLDFVSENRYFYRKDNEVAVEIPDGNLEGDIEKVKKVIVDEDLYIYLISIEDIIIDRLRASIHWRSEEDSVWGFKLLIDNFEHIDLDYIKNKLSVKSEKEEFLYWISKYNNT